MTSAYHGADDGPEAYRYVLMAKVYSYLEKHQDAVRILSDGLNIHPDSPHLYRHRGEFKIVLRDFLGAIEDLARAIDLSAAIPDEVDFYQAQLLPEVEKVVLGGASALMSTPTPVDELSLTALKDVYKGTLRSSSWYHFALAHFLNRDYEAAIEAFQTTIDVGADDDLRVAASDWLYLALSRAGRPQTAAVVLEKATRPGLQTNSDLYVRRLAAYAGDVEPKEPFNSGDNRRALATVGYAVGNWYLLIGNRDMAMEAFEAVIATGDKSAFGYIAAEGDLAELHAA
jgi:tetratricopeptide (TPR) repeat protein